MSPLLVLQARAEARALLFKCAEHEDSGEAVGALLVYATESGLLDDIGADGVVGIIKDAFKRVAQVEL